MIRHSNDYSDISNSIDYKKLLNITNKNEYLYKIYNEEDYGKAIQRQADLKKFENKYSKLVKNNNFYELYIINSNKLSLDEAKNYSFKKIAMNLYSFINRNSSINMLGKYNFDDGSVWKVIKDKNGKEIIIKEIKDGKILRDNKQA